MDVIIPREEPPPDDEELYDLDLPLITRGPPILRPTETLIYIGLDNKKAQRKQFYQKRAAPSRGRKTDSISQSVLMSAVNNDRDCNSILKGSSLALVTLLRK